MVAIYLLHFQPLFIVVVKMLHVMLQLVNPHLQQQDQVVSTLYTGAMYLVNTNIAFLQLLLISDRT